MPDRTRHRPTDAQLEAWLSAGPGGPLPGTATVFDLVEELRELRTVVTRTRERLDRVITDNQIVRMTPMVHAGQILNLLDPAHNPTTRSRR